MLDPALASQLAAYLGRVTLPVELIAALDDGAPSAQLRDLLSEIADMSPMISLNLTGDATTALDRRPSFRIRRAGTDVEVAFAGIPLGHEFSSLVLALLQVGGHPSTVDERLLDRIRGLEGEHRFETFLSLSCQNCPDVVQALNLMSIVNPRITHVAVDGAIFPEEAERRTVLAVPAVFRNGEPFAQGRMTLEEIVDKLDETAADREAETLSAAEPFDVLVIGGGPAGATAAIYAARKGIRTGLVVERFGGQVLDTMSIENFISVPRTEGPQFGAALENHVREYDVQVIRGRRALGVRAADVEGGLARVTLDNGATLSARTLVLATGARWRQMGVPGEEEYHNKGVTYCPHCDGPLFKGKRVAVIGGGNSGIEAAIDLAGVVEHVTVLEFDSFLRADEILQQALRNLPNVDVRLNALTTRVDGDGDRVTGLQWTNRETGTEERIPLEGVFVQIGLLPSTDWLAGAVELSPRGEIVIDSRGATSAPGIFAAGDCTTVPFKQIVIAVGAGATAALSAFDHLVRTRSAVEAVAAAEAIAADAAASTA
ncbi:MAG: NADH-dependent peroxiredoxin subunit [Actinomycetota bacterium]|nr:NADH-dependent peroxiredoxin subunit [Actinomycetota bacterium]